MRIHCDVCGAEITKDSAIVEELDCRILYFCSQACHEDLEAREVLADPDVDEDQTAPDLR